MCARTFFLLFAAVLSAYIHACDGYDIDKHSNRHHDQGHIRRRLRKDDAAFETAITSNNFSWKSSPVDVEPTNPPARNSSASLPETAQASNNVTDQPDPEESAQSVYWIDSSTDLELGTPTDLGPSKLLTPTPSTSSSLTHSASISPSLKPSASPSFPLKTFVTTFQSNAAYYGYMFDIVAKDTIAVTSMWINTHQITKSFTVQVYTRVGSYSGFPEVDLSAWTHVGNANVKGAGIDEPTMIHEAFDEGPTVIQRNQRQAFFLFTSDGPYLRSTKGAVEREEVAFSRNENDADIKLFQGIGKDHRGSHATYLWSGMIQYRMIDIPRSTSSLVSVDSSGSLVYANYDNQGQQNEVNTVPDFSDAGYQGGGVPIPFVPTKTVVRPSGKTGGDHDYWRIQRAIDMVSALPVGPDGFRGAIFLKAGDYDVSRTLTITTSGVVVRGEGSSSDGSGTRITYTATERSNLFELGARNQDTGTVWRDAALPVEIPWTRRAITDSYVPVGAKTFTVTNARRYRPGVEIVIQNNMNQKWLDDMSDMDQWGWTVHEYQLKHRRVITDVVGNKITVNAPIVQAIEDQYGGGIIYKYYPYSDQIESIGLEALRLESAYASKYDEDHGWMGIVFCGIKNGWARQVTGAHFGYGLVGVQSWSSYITIEDSAMLDHISRISGGRRYSFYIAGADFILFQRLLTRNGRHDFVSGAKTPGPNVFIDCLATNAYSDIGPHHRYSTGQLYDNVAGGRINVRNRGRSGSGHGWAGAQIMFWNVRGDVVCDAPHGAMNWAVGVLGEKKDKDGGEPFGIWDAHNNPVSPRSLYQAQLVDRLGPNASHGVFLPSQMTDDRVWSQLLKWDGEGLFLDHVVAWIDEQADQVVAAEVVSIGGAVRDLGILEAGFSSTWSVASGPGHVTFEDASSIHTSATFSSAGSFVLQLSIARGFADNVHAVLGVQVEEFPELV